MGLCGPWVFLSWFFFCVIRCFRRWYSLIRSFDALFFVGRLSSGSYFPSSNFTIAGRVLFLVMWVIWSRPLMMKKKPPLDHPYVVAYEEWLALKTQVKDYLEFLFYPFPSCY